VTPDQWADVERLFDSIRRADTHERVALLAAIADPVVRAEVASLLDADRDTGFTVAAVISEAAAAATDGLTGRTLGHFRVIKPIGRGGMGEVFLAEDVHLHRHVALKLLPLDVRHDSDRLLRFEREARAAAALNHPSIVTIHEVGHDAGGPFIVTELVEGETIEQRLTRGPMPVAETLDVAIQIADAVGAAHGKGIVHRDLKPANLMLTSSGVKVMDFGLAKFAPDQMMTQTGVIMGTPGYMAPEQWAGTAADARVDIYALGCLVYEMVTGVRAGPSRVPLPARALERIVSRCLQHDPADRWCSAEDLQQQLKLVRQPRRRLRHIVMTTLAAVALVGAFLWYPRTRAEVLTDKDVVLLSDFTNSTGDRVFDDTLRQALAIQLEQSPFVKIMDDGIARRDLRLMGHPAGVRITADLAHGICAREGAAATIEGSIDRLGQAFVVALEAVTCQERATLAREQTQAANKEHVLEALATVAGALRVKLGESLASVQEHARPLERYTTTSLEALQTYARGYELAAAGQYIAAIPFFRRATELDPAFAMAHQTLSIMYSNSGARPRAVESQRRAFALIDRVSDFERVNIEARYHLFATGDLARAADDYALTIREFPRYWAAPSELSTASRAMGDFEKSLAAAETARRLEPGVLPPYNNAALALIRLGRLADAKGVLAAAQARQLDAARVHQRLLEIAYIETDTAGAQREIMWFTGKPEEHVSFGTRAANADAFGQRRRAHELYRRAADMARQHDLAEAATEFDEADAMGAAWSGNCREGASGCPPLALAICGDGAAATRLAGEMSTELPAGTIWRQVQLPTIRAAIELRREQPARAMEILASALAYERAYPEVPYLRGLSYLHLKRNAEAAAEFHKVVDHRPASWGIIHAVSHLGLARASARSGDVATAQRAYQALLALWNDADASALLSAARSELSALQSAGPRRATSSD
jgi:eukaryotic-like serine/threonine-protein kinase